MYSILEKTVREAKNLSTDINAKENLKSIHNMLEPLYKLVSSQDNTNYSREQVMSKVAEYNKLLEDYYPKKSK